MSDSAKSDFGELMITMKTNYKTYILYLGLLIVFSGFAVFGGVFKEIYATKGLYSLIGTIFFVIITTVYCVYCLTYKAQFYERGFIIGPILSRHEVPYSLIKDIELYSTSNFFYRKPQWKAEITLEDGSSVFTREHHFEKHNETIKSWQYYYNTRVKSVGEN